MEQINNMPMTGSQQNAMIQEQQMMQAQQQQAQQQAIMQLVQNQQMLAGALQARMIQGIPPQTPQQPSASKGWGGTNI